ncbi:RNA-directed DNA polymerase, eukaryota [Tanacetum coccineum]
MTGINRTKDRRNFSSNEDLTRKISHSVFVTNFPDSVNSRDLWNRCSVYGTVVDVFIPSKKSKVGKRFAFVRFIKVFDLDRLVANLCTLWIGSYHLYANQVRYDRPQKQLNSQPNAPVSSGLKTTSAQGMGFMGSKQQLGRETSYISAVNGYVQTTQPGSLLSTASALMLDDECVVERDFSKCAIGKVKVFDSIPKVQNILAVKQMVP